MVLYCLSVKCILQRCPISGAKVDLVNNDNKLPYDLAKDPETAAHLKLAGKLTF